MFSPPGGHHASPALHPSREALCALRFISGTSHPESGAQVFRRCDRKVFNDIQNLNEVNHMKRAFFTVASLGLIALLASAWPDLRRYMRIRAM
jgi:hypothetical protein